MNEPALPELPAPDFDELVAELAKLSRNHLLFFRIEVGRRLSNAFYGHDPARYRASRGVKGSSFRRFAAERASELADLGLSDGQLRESLCAFFVVNDLPHELITRLDTPTSSSSTASRTPRPARPWPDSRWTTRGPARRWPTPCCRSGQGAGRTAILSNPGSSRSRPRSREPPRVPHSRVGW